MRATDLLTQHIATGSTQAAAYSGFRTGALVGPHCTACGTTHSSTDRRTRAPTKMPA